ncbi:MAG TPA: alkaline phosphatase family protein [Anaerolineales bacterium]
MGRIVNFIIATAFVLACTLTTPITFLSGGSSLPAPSATAQLASPSEEPAAATPNATATLGAPTAAPSADSLALAQAKIKHVVIILQENRSFDQYFGTYPGADGIPMQGGVPTVCLPDPQTHQCERPFHNPLDTNVGGPHDTTSAKADIAGGQMNGFVDVFRESEKPCSRPPGPGTPTAVATPTATPPPNFASTQPSAVFCQQGITPDVMGWHDAREIPNYWTYARNFVLQDKMFAPSSAGSVPEHLFLVSGWSAKCSQPSDASTCVSALDEKGGVTTAASEYPWTDLTYLLYQEHVSWTYYLSEGSQPDCADNQMLCQPGRQVKKVPSIWNPLPAFDTVKQDGQLALIQTVDQFYVAAKHGDLPAVSWIIPNSKVSEHPPASIHDGQAYVTGLINAVMQGPDWDSTVIFLSWDDWGGFYDHVTPPAVDQNGYGIRVPGLMISAYARKGMIDHQALSFDAYLKFIEDIFLNGQRIDPQTDGRPDPRPTVRENVPALGNLLSEFDFSQKPRPPLILATNPPPGPASIP